LVIATTDSNQAKKITRWARQWSVRYERWTVTAGQVSSAPAAFYNPHGEPPNLLEEVSALAAGKWAPEIYDALAEYCPLMASALSRASRIAPTEFLSDFRVANARVGQILAGRRATVSQKVAMLTDLNAALSRCTSQTFSGSSPIAETECHYWAHSLLGTGVANIALARIRSFVEGTIGKARLPSRVAEYSRITEDVPNFVAAELNDSVWNTLFMDHAASSPKGDRDLFPLITYLSGRAGFNTTETTLSAPLSAITSCNSLKWSLFTLTHELSHEVVHAVLGRLLPKLSNKKAVAAAAKLLSSTKPAKTLFAEAQRFILQTMVEMQSVAESKENIDVDADNLPIVIRNCLEQVEELMVHSFDYLYFYAEKVKYIPAIWHSWGVLPYITDKIPDYVMRSLCTISLEYAGEDAAVGEAARRRLEEEFVRMSRHYRRDSHVHQALEFLRTKWDSELAVPLVVRLPIPRFVRSLLYSPRLARSFQGERSVVGSSRSRRRDYPHALLEFGAEEVQNPLHFIEMYTKLLRSQAASVWMLHTLAFNTRPNGTS
jgi:hypothetical protein